jgi:predicted nucleic acid-binding protein
VVTIDASVFVAADVADERAHEAAHAFLENVLATGLEVHEPGLAVVETASAVARRTGDSAHARAVATNVLELPGVVFHDLDVDAAAGAAGLTSELRLRAADAVYAATALATGTILVTLDKELAERCAGVIRVLTPGEWITEREA